MGKARHSKGFYSEYSAPMDEVWCREHNKQGYISRKLAKSVMSRTEAFEKQRGMVGKVYPCEGSDPQRFHIGHTTPAQVAYYRGNRVGAQE